VARKTYHKTANELAIVHNANRKMLEDINEKIETSKRELCELHDALEQLSANDKSAVSPGLLLGDNNGATSETPFLNTTPSHDSLNTSVATDWDSIVRASAREIESYGLDPAQMSLYDLLSPEENAAIQHYLNRPFYERIPWDKWDYIFAFGTGIVGGALDILLGTPGLGLQKLMADKTTWIGSQMERIHSLHPNGAPIDYTGKHFGGPRHRGRSRGHDLFGALESIRQFKDGQFRGFYWVNGEKIPFESFLTPHGNTYTPSEGWGEAVLAWMIHMICDFFSSESLPIPGTSYLHELDSREIRVFVQNDLYGSGFNLRHLALEAIPPLSIEVIIRSYMYFRYRKQTLNRDAIDQKKLELLMIGHTICAGFNLGKVCCMQNPLLINIPQMMALTKTLIRLIVQEHNRTAFIAKVERNIKDLRRTQREYEPIIHNNILAPIILS